MRANVWNAQWYMYVNWFRLTVSSVTLHQSIKFSMIQTPNDEINNQHIWHSSTHVKFTEKKEGKSSFHWSIVYTNAHYSLISISLKFHDNFLLHYKTRSNDLNSLCSLTVTSTTKYHKNFTLKIEFSFHSEFDLRQPTSHSFVSSEFFFSFLKPTHCLNWNDKWHFRHLICFSTIYFKPYRLKHIRMPSMNWVYNIQSIKW